MATMVLVGVHPSLTQVPPTCSRSMRAVRMPASARAVESGVPACPEPITMASNCCGVVIGASKIMYRNPGKCKLPGDALPGGFKLAWGPPAKADMCKVLHICLRNASHVERTYQTITDGRTMQPW